MSPDVATPASVLVAEPSDATPFRYPHAETFPGAARYPTLGSAMIFHVIMPDVWQQSKAAPLQELVPTVHRSLSCSDLAQRALLDGYGRQNRFRPGVY